MNVEFKDAFHNFISWNRSNFIEGTVKSLSLPRVGPTESTSAHNCLNKRRFKATALMKLTTSSAAVNAFLKHDDETVLDLRTIGLMKVYEMPHDSVL